MENNREVLLKVEHLCQYFRLGRKDLKAVDDVSFDVYKGDALTKLGKMSIAVKLTFQAKDRTLKDEDVNKEIENILSALKEKLGINLR